MPVNEKPLEYRIRWDDGDGERQVRAEADPETGTITLLAPGAKAVPMDVVTARATSMILAHMVYAVLEPTGPLLTIEAYDGHRWFGLREYR